MALPPGVGVRGRGHLQGDGQDPRKGGAQEGHPAVGPRQVLQLTGCHQVMHPGWVNFDW